MPNPEDCLDDCLDDCEECDCDECNPQCGRGYQGIVGPNAAEIIGPQGYEGSMYQAPDGAQGFQGSLCGCPTHTLFEFTPGVLSVSCPCDLNTYRGVQGAQGAQGSSFDGPQGAQGAQGGTTNGLEGAQGLDGNQGAQGVFSTGPQGFIGSSSTGLMGPQGVSGASLVGPTGFAGRTYIYHQYQEGQAASFTGTDIVTSFNSIPSGNYWICFAGAVYQNTPSLLAPVTISIKNASTYVFSQTKTLLPNQTSPPSFSRAQFAFDVYLNSNGAVYDVEISGPGSTYVLENYSAALIEMQFF